MAYAARRCALGSLAAASNAGVCLELGCSLCGERVSAVQTRVDWSVRTAVDQLSDLHWAVWYVYHI